MADDTDLFGEESPPAPPDPSITREHFLEWRSPRRGTSNPETLTNPVWDWLVRSKLSGYQANKHFEGPSAFDEGPCWSFDRCGQSSTPLTDGRIIRIGGEHEDSYDPDFFIYNDVTVRHPDGRIEMLGYPTDPFPPTDFHSATLVGNQIIIVGNLGYPERRRPEETQVLKLDLETFSVAPVQTSGTSPGWIHKHIAELADDGKSILIRRGELARSGSATFVENIDDWRLHLANWRWERLTERRWPRWDIARSDGKRNHLWYIQQAVWDRSVRWEEDLRKKMDELEETLGARPDLDLAESLFHPPVPHEEIPEVEDEYDVTRIRIDGVVIRYVADMFSIQVTVEGDLPQATVEAVTSDLVTKISALENASFHLEQI